MTPAEITPLQAAAVLVPCCRRSPRQAFGSRSEQAGPTMRFPPNASKSPF